MSSCTSILKHVFPCCPYIDKSFEPYVSGEVFDTINSALKDVERYGSTSKEAYPEEECLEKSSSDNDDTYAEISLVEPDINNTNSTQRKCNFTKTQILTNIAAPLILAGAGAALFTQYSGNQDSKILTAAYLSIGAATRALLEANLPKHIMDNIHNPAVRWSFETFEFLWQAYLNTGDIAIIDALVGLAGFYYTGDAVKAYNQKQEDWVQNPLTEVSKEKPVNPILYPAYNNNKNQGIVNTATSVAGAALSIFGYIQMYGAGFDVEILNDMAPFISSTGNFLAFRSIGFYIMKLCMNALRKNQQANDNFDMEAALANTPSGFKKTALSILIKAAPRVSAEMLAALLLFDHPEIYIPAGILFGMTEISQKHFEELTPAMFEAQQKNNTTTNPCTGNKMQSVGLLVEKVASAVFLAGFYAWFGWGESDLNGYVNDQIVVGTLMAAVLATAGLAAFTEWKFKPGENGRVINTIRYIFNHHLFSLPLLYFIFKQNSKTNDMSLETDSTYHYVLGAIALTFFGVNFIANRARGLASNRETTFMPPVVRMLLLKRIVERWLNVYNL